MRGTRSMVMIFHGNVRGEVRVNFLAFFASEPHIFMWLFPHIVPNLCAPRCGVILATDLAISVCLALV